MQRYTNAAQDALGNVIQGMSVSVFLQGTQTLATIYSDNGVTTKPNPTTTDALGTFFFYAANGRYDLQFAKTGLPTTQLQDILLLDVSDPSFVPGTSVNIYTSRLNISGNLIGPGTLKSTAVASGGDFGIIANNVTIRDITFVGSQEAGGQILFDGVASMDSLHLDNIKVKNTIGGAAQIGVQIASSAPTRFSLVNSDVATTGFAVLVNTGANNGSSVVISNNRRIYSEKADAVNLNNEFSTFSDAVISGNIIESAAATGEFAISVANTKNVSITGNVVLASKLEAVHIESAQSNINVSGNSLRGCVADGVKILNNSGTIVAAGAFVVGTAYTILVVGTTDFTLIGASANTVGISFIATGVGAGTGTATVNPAGIIVSNNQIRAAAGNVSNGINLVADGSGTVDGCTVNGNHVYGFQRGIALGFGVTQSCEGNIVENATDAYFAVGSAVEPAHCQHSGANYARNCTNLVVIHNHGTFGKVISSTKPTAILIKEVVDNSPAMMMGFAFPSGSLNHGGGGAQLFTLFPVGDRMNGRITLIARFPGNSHTANYMADILWNGAALTINNPYTDLHGDFTAITVAVNAGNFQVSITSAVVHNGFLVATNFDGQYWKL